MLSSIVVATDGSEASDRMLECAEGLRRLGGRQATLVHVFHVRDVGGLYESLQLHTLPKLERQAGKLRAAGFAVGSQGRGFIREVFLGSVANQVARLAPLPVLFVPAAR